MALLGPSQQREALRDSGAGITHPAPGGLPLSEECVQRERCCLPQLLCVPGATAWGLGTILGGHCAQHSSPSTVQTLGMTPSLGLSFLIC